MPAICGLTLSLAGWRFVSELPNTPKGVAIFGPHTSNWDFLIGMAVVFALELRVAWMGKHTLFRKPFGRIARWLGGIPIDRRASQGMIPRMVAEFGKRDRFLLVIAPEGTRKKVPRWKTGFYYIALEAQVPIFVVGLDYPGKIISFGPLIRPTGDYDRDVKSMQLIVSRNRGKRIQ